MIAKVPPARRDRKTSFRDLTNYCLGVTGHGKRSVLHVGTQNLHSPETAAVEMEALAIENVRCKAPAFHFILSWREMESPTMEQVDEAVKIALTELDLQDCQALWALQSDTDNLHVHVAVNRISPETYRAIHPAKGWTKKALEKAARKIEIAQGWEIERTGRYDVDAEGNIHEKDKTELKKPEVSQKARDIEAHTGRESVERIAKREIAPILQTAVSWDELHRKLAKRGFFLDRKGKGAVLCYGHAYVKLSRISREYSFSKLEKLLGDFQERGEDIHIDECQDDKEPSSEADLLSEIDESDSLKNKRAIGKSLWKKYDMERTAYLEAKLKAIKDLREIQKTERQDLRLNYKGFLGELFKKSWKGKGQELNQMRSVFAYAYRKKLLELRERHNEELVELKSHYLRRFPSYKQWLADQKSEDLYRVYRYPGQLVLTPEQSGVIKVPAQSHFDLRDYSARKGAGYSVLYCRNGGFTADFSDMGKRIVLNKNKLDESSVAAALQLANQKWGATQINGSAEYKELCVSVAVKYNLKLANPDLAAEVERRRNAMRNASKQTITQKEIEALNLADSPKIYLNPRTDNQQYKGEIVHVDTERGFCVQRVGKQSLFVHMIERLETSPNRGENVRIFYENETGKARVERQEVRQKTLSL